jgi:hypothetical protein
MATQEGSATITGGASVMNFGIFVPTQQDY